MRGALLIAMLLLSSGAHAQDLASNLWLTPDQRGDRLLLQGDAKTAAQTYADPHRRAYAALKAGDYDAAARDLAKLDDSDAHYNRGNALVGSGDLQGAMQAYDAALKHDPHNADARHNRDLVERALKQQQQQQQQQQQPSGQQDASSKDSQNASSNPSGQNDDQDKDQDQQQGAGNEKAQDNPKPSSPQQHAQDGKGVDRKNPSSEAPSKPDASQSNPSSASDDQATPPSENEAEQARRDVADSARSGAPDQQNPTEKSPSAAAPGEDSQANKPQTEQQLAQDQWLRRIPDDPGGLLRRKFMIEHLRRQQERQSPQEGSR